MSFEENAMSELKAVILSIKEPYIDISNPNKLFEDESILSSVIHEPNEKFPIVTIYIESEDTELVANDRFENSLYVGMSIHYLIDRQKESIAKGKERGSYCIQQIITNILNRQRTGKALVSLYLSGNIQKEITHFLGVDAKETDFAIGAVTTNFTLKHIMEL